MFKRRLLPLALGLGLVAALVLLRAADPYPVQVLREIGFDFYQQLQPRPPADWPVRVVDIDEAALTAEGQWPWPRDRLALLVERLTELGAAVIAIDMLFPEPDRWSPDGAHDRRFATALAAVPTVMGFAVSPGVPALPGKPKAGFAVSGSDPLGAVPQLPGAVLPLPELREAAAGLGSLSLNSSDAGGIVRRIPLLWAAEEQYYSSLAVEALRLAFGASTLVVLGDTGGQGYVDALRIGGLTVPTSASGDLWIHYRESDPALYVSAADLLGPDYRAQVGRVAGHIVLVGTSASGLLDLHGTPLGENVPGVSIHAQALEQMLSGSFLVRADWVSGLEIVGFAILGSLLVVTVLQLGPLAGLLLGAAALLAALGASWFMFATSGVMIDASFPLLGLLLLYLALVFIRFLTTDADKRQLRRAFGYYVAPALLEEIERNSARLQLGGELREVTVLFTDVRDFTPLSERLAPQEIVSVLNTLFGALGARIVEQLGTIDKFMGDSIMAFWNAPVDVDDHARRACRAALGMRATLRELNAGNAFGLRGRAPHPEQLVCGVGIASGAALAGNMGLETRFDYSVVGDTVNVASRVEGACKDVGYDIVVVEATRAAAPDYAYLEAGSIRLKGKSRREPIHVLVGDADLAASTGFVELRTAHARAVGKLRAGAAAPGDLAACKALAAAVEPGLLRFYDRLGERQADFVEAAAE
ncbi:MAG TPA: adenylate/guanylate cyclase domain-containing protein [Devosiaceae bacterium]|jgi:adenylate cyclase|nr:adenylate/guanylate cyclase domain-containing protein [Devosiaceae bacterium]